MAIANSLQVIDSSDVILHVLDARDPLGTRCHSVEKYMREEAPHKHLIFVLNKCDLVPTSVAVSIPTLLVHFLLHLTILPFPRFIPIVQVKASSDHLVWSLSNGSRLLQLWESNAVPAYIGSLHVLCIDPLEFVRFGSAQPGGG